MSHRRIRFLILLSIACAFIFLIAHFRMPSRHPDNRVVYDSGLKNKILLQLSSPDKKQVLEGIVSMLSAPLPFQVSVLRSGDFNDTSSLRDIMEKCDRELKETVQWKLLYLFLLAQSQQASKTEIFNQVEIILDKEKDKTKRESILDLFRGYLKSIETEKLAARSSVLRIELLLLKCDPASLPQLRQLLRSKDLNRPSFLSWVMKNGSLIPPSLRKGVTDLYPANQKKLLEQRFSGSPHRCRGV